jgi:hypothetical protein
MPDDVKEGGKKGWKGGWWFITSPMELMMGVLDLFAVHWIVKGLRPSYTVSNLVAGRSVEFF